MLSGHTRILLRIFLVLLCLPLVACDSSSPDGPAVSPDVLDEGDAWTYDALFTLRPLDASTVDTLRQATIRVRVADTNATVNGTSGLIELASFSDSRPDAIQRTWYRQSPDSLVAVAYNPGGAGITFSKGTPSLNGMPAGHGLLGLPLLVRRRMASPPQAQTLPIDTIGRDDARVVLRAPLDPGASWTSFEQPFLSTRTVARVTTVNPPAGSFLSVDVETTLSEFGPSFDWSDYYASDGLVRRVVTDTTELRNEEGESLGEGIVREQYVLTDLRR
jgi:hypothetical protein